MENTTVDVLNKILTNILEYKDVLIQLEKIVSHGTTKEKLSDLAKVREKYSQDLIRIISDEGGDVQSTKRVTDHKMVSWVQSPVPEKSEMEKIVSFLIRIEKNALKDYKDVIENQDIFKEGKEILERHRKEIEVDLKYFETARQTLEKR